MLLLYGEMETMMGWVMKKKRKRLVLKMYWYGALIFACASLIQKYRDKDATGEADKNN